jgi:uncharacterized membrane protein
VTSYRLDQPELLLILLLAAPIIWLGVRSLTTLDPLRRFTAIGLRLLVLLVLALILAGLQSVRRHSDLTAIAVLDTSESVRRFAAPPTAPTPAPGSGSGSGSNAVDHSDAAAHRTIDQWMRDYVARASTSRRTDDRVGLITYDGRPTVRSLPSLGPVADEGALDAAADGTDSAAALRLAMALFPADSGKRILWASDGNDTALGGMAASMESGGGDDVLTVAREAAAAGIPIDVLPIPYQLDNEVMVEGVYAPTEAREKQTIALRVVLRAARPSEGLLYLRHDGQTVNLTGDAASAGLAVLRGDWTLEEESDASSRGLQPRLDSQRNAGRYVLVRTIELALDETGVNRFEAVYEPAQNTSGETSGASSGGTSGGGGGGDVIAANNRAEGFTLVQGQGRVLVLNNEPTKSDDPPDAGFLLPRALQARGLTVDVVPGNALPTRLSQLQRYDAVILENVPAEMMTTGQQKMLARYVHDLGGGLIMLGGPDSFGAGGWTNSPIDDILPVDCQIPSQTILPSGALVIVLDRSGSMSSPVAGTNHTQQEVANEAAVLALSTLYPDDLVAVVAFDHSAQVIVPLTPNFAPGSTAKLIRSIQPNGGTNIYTGLDAAWNILKDLPPQDAAVKHVILLTDGQSQEGDTIGTAKNMVRADITISTVGVGDGQNSQLLFQLATMAGGQFYPIADPNQLPQVFIKEARTIRKNLVKEQPFQPQLVNTGSPIMAGITAAPNLQGLVLTGPKNRPGVFMPLLGAEGEPLFAHWQVGLGRTAAFTSDATSRWAQAWVPWDGYADFWTRTVRHIARPTASRNFDLVTSIQGDSLHIRLDASADENAAAASSASSASRSRGSFTNYLAVRGAILAPDGSAQSVTLTQTGPGVYEARVPADQAGNYVVSLFAADPLGEQRQAVFGGASKPPGAELRNFRSNRALLEEVARITGGRVLEPTAAQTPNLFTRDVPFESRSVRPLWRPLLYLLLILIWLDIACRRIAWDLPAIWRWFRGRVAAMSQAMRPRHVEAAATLGALKARAARFDQDHEPEPAPGLPASAGMNSSGAPASAGTQGSGAPASAGTQGSGLPASAGMSSHPGARKTKFEARPDYQPAPDVTAAVGGASENEESGSIAAGVRAAQACAKQSAGPMTSRLLDAKRKTRERLSGSDEN